MVLLTSIEVLEEVRAKLGQYLFSFKIHSNLKQFFPQSTMQTMDSYSRSLPTE